MQLRMTTPGTRLADVFDLRNVVYVRILAANMTQDHKRSPVNVQVSSGRWSVRGGRPAVVDTGFHAPLDCY